MLSIQSYKRNAYDSNSLEVLRALADHCGDALERIRGQEALQRAEERLHHMLAQSPAVIYSRKPAAEGFALSWASENLSQLLGFSPEEACQPDWWQKNLHPADRDRLGVARTGILAENRAALEYRFQHKDGKYRWLRDEQRFFSTARAGPRKSSAT